ncbi:MAG TPA: ATP-binding protein [Pyrinomonadaceae bacterium]|nr:ATP-binding protein [Pyrinomonadaceae bacterium]
MTSIAARHHLGVLGIDEIQHLNAAKSGGADEMLNFFVKLINKIGLPVILIGTYEAASLLGGTFRQARRGSGQGDLVWNWMEFDEEWRLFIETLWGLQYVKEECSLTPALSRTLHEVSYGVIDLAIRIYLAAQIRAIETGQEMINEGLLRSAYRDDFKLLSRIVEVLRSGDSAAIAKIGDVCPPSVVPVHEIATAPEQPDGEHNLANGARAASAQNPNGNGSGGRKASKEDDIKIIQGFFSRGKGRGSKDITFEHGDLRGIVTQGAQSKPPVSPYQSLLDAGIIKPSSEFLS